MPDEPESKDGSTDDSLSPDEFKAGVLAIAGLRDEGKALLYFNRRASFRVVAEPEVLQAALAPDLKGEAAAERATLVYRELQSVIHNVVRFDSLDIALRIAERGRFDHDRDSGDSEAPEARRKEFRAKYKQKLTTASESLVTAAVRDRFARLRSSTGPCLEDLDFELVKERRESLRDITIDRPFIRIRVRYSDIRQEQYLGGLLAFGGPDSIGSPSSFEIECDASDIDLLIKRLSDAKQRLLKAETSDPEPD